MYKTGLYWFNHDLRVHDNTALLEASLNCEQLICLFCFDSAWFKQTGLNAKPMGLIRRQFIEQCLHDLAKELKNRGQRLIVMTTDPVSAISVLIKNHEIDVVYRSHHVGVFETRQWHHLRADFPRIAFHSIWTHTLFRPEQLPFGLNHLPTTFTEFKQACETIAIDKPVAMPQQLAPPVDTVTGLKRTAENVLDSHKGFNGGEKAALQHLDDYFSSELPQHYKTVRNELDGWDNSTKMSAWLASGALSPRKLIDRLQRYEKDNVANESTYWIYYELLWREYFQWYAQRYQHKLFRPEGINKQRVSCCFYPERYQKWCHGNTPYPIVNACMKQLNQTGYMSNRGRQIVASCLVNELQLDWRFGAAYFEQQLVDYDVASNWGNWQYIAGVGADPRGGRHFNLEKQTATYDPEHHFIRQWHGEANQYPLDSVDAADWPIMPNKDE
ncbi:MAG: deoxyribodipyrimidine photolyase [Methylophaga sp.]|uniref:DASH family cryptochrome n=1 Tax=Methylophaga sp. UBA678 TaxID=1946901 RepID=UPI000C35600C|nr:DASH family cryptochrome [Methylophaga sp. UBA678]MAX51017.1 deoxyribodipyrimidine photolyase [Methylophaga sp.]|tara:strand:+ start:35102 stop:36427 length:1326 start_codon:yes stop_codon:yes gene_type:complete